MPLAKDDLLIILKLKPDAIPIKRKQHVDSEDFFENSLVAQEEKKHLIVFQVIKFQNFKIAK